MMKNSAPPADLLRLTMANLFCAVGDHLGGIAKTQMPKTLSDHLMAIFMACTEFYHAGNVPMPAEMTALLNDMYRTAHRPDGAHALELMRAVDVISHRPSLRNDSEIRIAIARANIALINVVL